MMRLPLWLLGVLALALLIGLATPVLADDKPGQANQNTQAQKDQTKQAMDTARGEITKVMADQHRFTLKADNGREWTFRVGQNDKIRVNDKETSLADLKTGEQITVHFRLQARDINTGDATKTQDLAQGQITQVQADQNQFVLKDRQGKDWTFRLAPGAMVRLNDKDTKLADLKTGDNATIVYQKQNDQFQAREVCSARGHQAPGITKGEVTMVNGTNRQLTLKGRDGKERTFQVGQNAKVRVNGQDSNLANLKQGNEVLVTYALIAQDIRTGQQQNR